MTLTENAAQKILSLINEEKSLDPLMFRIMISGGGCSGFQYGFSLDHQINEDDTVFEERNVKVVIDEASLPLVEGAQIDYVEELIGASFVVKNPNASTSCGCGNSFSI
ncbi:MAG: iron-sulfur cluster insertion protein ErpA [Alphaproteobacteria bacterium]|nr:iron-sulfur cluster insertion protein ErpA [Alphaproteobacteria bacterium]